MRRTLLALALLLAALNTPALADVFEDLQVNSAAFYTDPSFTTLEGGSLSGGDLTIDTTTGSLTGTLTTTTGSLLTGSTYTAGFFDGSSLVLAQDLTTLESLVGGFIPPGDQVLLANSFDEVGDTVSLLVTEGACLNTDVTCSGQDLVTRFAEVTAQFVVPAPEPASIALMGVGLLGMATVVSRRRRV
jgi:PEP-CTERM motif